MVREQAPCHSVHHQFRSRCRTPTKPLKLHYQFFTQCISTGLSFASITAMRSRLAASMRMGLSNSCTFRPALYTERVSGADARTRTRSGVNRKSSALIDTVCIDPSHARRVATTRPRTEILQRTRRTERNCPGLSRHISSPGCRSFPTTANKGSRVLIAEVYTATVH